MTVKQARQLKNRESHEKFYGTWDWAEPWVNGGFTAVMRVKNEARNLPFVLPPLLRSVDNIILIDNQSDDDTAGMARRLAEEAGASERLSVLEYPFVVSRCGSEHLGTPADSVHSLTYFYNWSFSHVQTTYALKWDGDMVLTIDGERVFRDLAWRLEAFDVTVTIPRMPLYVRSPDEAYIDTALRNREPWAWPNKKGYWFGKGVEWELQLRPEGLPVVTLPEWVCFEIKWLDEDEFAHWTKPEDFEDSGRTVRKRREWEVYNALISSDRVPDGVIRVESGANDHVIETVRTTRRLDWAAEAG